MKIIHAKRELKYDYQIMSNGDVISGKYKRKLATCLDKDGYVKVSLTSTDNKRHLYSVHRLVAENFMPVDNMENLQINHIDGNKQNNDISNLEWCDCVYNIHHAIKIGLRQYEGSGNPSARLSDDDVREIVRLRNEEQYMFKDIAAKFDVSVGAIERIMYGRTYKNVTSNIESSTIIPKGSRGKPLETESAQIG